METEIEQEQEQEHDGLQLQEAQQDKPSGFISKEEWVELGRDPEKWRDEKEFNDFGEKLKPVKEDTVRYLKRELEENRRIMRESSDATMRLLHEARVDAYNKAVAELRTQQREAAAVGDVEKYDEVSRKIELQKAPEPPKPVNEPRQIDPVFLAWADDNPWYGGDPELTKEAELIGKLLMETRPELAGTGRKFYDAVKMRVKALYPEKMSGGRKETNSRMVESSNYGAASRHTSSKESYESLPNEAQAQAKRDVKSGYYKSVDDWAKVYYSNGR